MWRYEKAENKTHERKRQPLTFPEKEEGPPPPPPPAIIILISLALLHCMATCET